MKIKQKSKGFVLAGSVALYNHPKSKVYENAFNKYKAIKIWDSAVSQFLEEASEATKAIDFKDGALFVACLSKEMANEIKIYAQRIIYLINQLLGRVLVYELRVEC